MSGNWEFYFSNVNGALASLFVNLDIRPSAPDSKRPHLLWIWVYLQTPREDGLSSKEESAALHAIEDAIVKALHDYLEAQYVGRITTSGRREFYCYASSTQGFSRLIQETLKPFVGYKFEMGTQLDENWSQYLDLLYPLPEQFRSIENRKVVEALQEQGDNLAKPRPVKHWLYFESYAAREQYIQAVLTRGYQVKQVAHSGEAQRDQPFGLVIERVDRVDWQSIDAVVIELFQLAKSMNGDYDGWETSVEK